MSDIIVSVVMITYGHEKFISRAIDGVLMQKGDFDLELIIANDCSPDNTHEIIEDFIKNHDRGNRIKNFRHENNLGIVSNFMFALQQPKGKYIALCEGDDFWIDPLKLQKQISFLEKNPDFALCGTKIQTENLGEIGVTNHSKIYGEVTLDELLWKNQFGTCSVVFRAKYLKIPPFPNYPKFFTGDWPLWCSLLKQGKGYNMDDITAQYTVHAGGASSGRNRINTLKNKLEDRILMLDNFPEKKTIIKKYGNKIIFHYTWKSLLGHKDYYRALVENKKLVKAYLFY